ncbi:Beta-barrel assembly machine subunit BamB [Arsukibacterium tuosuense]|uniref:Outer membrane protein assembly factor BamB n=1 Tax=Arsukibacterium tuosuense TaxID=1323745 RepID=A0A285JFN2_9GAMM|nr:outer membrane protein assembly factor BamB [Arsukibacterium tuosuense]SNY57961.1 Beta-barrel assembly machine subunit BamB [Arsukibacterium tuosuense]
MKLFGKLTAAVVVALALTACSSKEKLVLPDVQNSISPKKVWQSNVGNGVEHYESGLKPVIVTDKVYAASRDGIVEAKNLSNGRTLWSFDLRDEDETSLLARLSGDSARIAGGVTFNDNKLYLGTEDGEVFALNAETGELLWRVAVKGEVLASPAVDAGLLVVATTAGTLIALDAATGEQRWTFEDEQPALTIRGVSEPVIEAGGVIYGSGTGRVGVLIADRGYQAWEEAIASPQGSTDLSRLVDVDAKPIVVAGTLYAIAYNGELVAMELRSGRQLWKRDYASFRNMAVAGNILYLVDSTGGIYAVDRRNGSEVWGQQGLQRHFLTGPTVYKDYLVVGDNEGNLHWLNRDNGDFVARQSMDGSGFYREAVATDDYILVTSRNGELVLLQVP